MFDDTNALKRNSWLALFPKCILLARGDVRFVHYASRNIRPYEPPRNPADSHLTHWTPRNRRWTSVLLVHNRGRILLQRVDPICLLLSRPRTFTLTIAFLLCPIIRLSI